MYRNQENFMINDKILSKAIDAYYRFCDENGFLYQEPSSAYSEVINGGAILRNVQGFLGKYSVEKDTIIPYHESVSITN